MDCVRKAADRLSIAGRSSSASWDPPAIVRYVNRRDSEKALALYKRIRASDAPSLRRLGVAALMALLKACALLKDANVGRELHAQIDDRGLLRSDAFIGCSLVDMYSKCGLMVEAQDAFNMLLVRDVVSWNALISGYAEHGLCEEAFYCLERVRFDGLSPNASTFGSCLRACTSVGNAVRGQEIHGEIVKKGLEADALLGNTLLDMYTKCGLLPTARFLFDKLPERDVVSWNVLMDGYVEAGQGEKALCCFEQMKRGRICPTSVSFVCVLKACGATGNLEMGEEVHMDMVNRGLEEEILVGNSLLDMYVRCNSIANARATFQKLACRDVISWTCLIHGFAEHGCSEEALCCLEEMEHQLICPNSVTFVCGLKACGSISHADRGKLLHIVIVKRGFEKEGLIGNALIDMYCKCSFLVEAQAVCDRLPVQDMVSWTALIRGLVEHEHGEEAFDCLEKIQRTGVLLDCVAMICSLRACGITNLSSKGQGVHTEIINRGLIDGNALIGSSLIDMYNRYGLLKDARKVFDNLPSRDIVSWSLLIAGCSEHGNGDDVLRCIETMQHDGIIANVPILICIIKACANIRGRNRGIETHAEITKRGLDDDLLICNTLLDMYAKFGLLEEVSKTFHSLPAWDAVSWNCLLEAYTEQGHAEEALGHYAVVQQSSIALDQVAFVSYLKACGSTRTVIKGQEIHGEIVSKGFETEATISASLIDMYGRCGWLITAQKVLDLLQDRDTVSWNALLSAYAEAKLFEEVINCAEHMQNEGILLNAATFACVLKSCMCIGGTVYGQKMYMDIVRRGLEHLPTVGSILIHMYSRTGYFEEKLQMFEELTAVDVCSWNILISGYVQVGQSECVFHIVDRMIDKGITLNLATFAFVLNACSHAGVVNKGLMYFKAMIKFYGYIPAIEHYNCMIDLFGRADCITMAMALIDRMPLHPDIVVWHTLLGACQNWNMVDFGKLAFEHAVRINENSAAAYLFMWNVYASSSQIDLETEGQVG